jgi:hypothetical protein
MLRLFIGNRLNGMRVKIVDDGAGTGQKNRRMRCKNKLRVSGICGSCD